MIYGPVLSTPGIEASIYVHESPECEYHRTFLHVCIVKFCILSLDSIQKLTYTPECSDIMLGLSVGTFRNKKIF